MKHIPDQQQDPLYQQVILLLSLLPVLKHKKMKKEETLRYNSLIIQANR